MIRLWMPRRQPIVTSTFSHRPRRRFGLATCLLVLVTTFAIPAGAHAATPSFDDHAAGPGGDSASVNFLRPPSRPPLPARLPQIGPEIKRAYMDDIDLRTTAFVPQPGEWIPDFPIPDEERWIRVDLSEQTLIAYERDKPVRAFIISSGLPGTPTVTGEFRIRAKVRSQTMSGGSEELGTYYSLPNVQWVQYFYEDYGFHGSYWHNNFGNPMSHGCVNMTNADARWLFDWAGPEWDGRHWMSSTESNQGTLVIVHE